MSQPRRGKGKGATDIGERLSRIEASISRLSDEPAYRRPTSGAPSYDDVRKKILDEVNRLFGVPSEILLSTRERGHHTQARCLAIILFHRHLNLNLSHLTRIFGYKQPSTISVRVAVFKKVLGGAVVSAGEAQFARVYTSDFIRLYNEADSVIAGFKKQQPQE